MKFEDLGFLWFRFIPPFWSSSLSSISSIFSLIRLRSCFQLHSCLIQSISDYSKHSLFPHISFHSFWIALPNSRALSTKFRSLLEMSKFCRAFQKVILSFFQNTVNFDSNGRLRDSFNPLYFGTFSLTFKSSAWSQLIVNKWQSSALRLS
jgi:hypothetical protein